MKFTPLQDRVVIKRASKETVSAGGLIIPGNVGEEPNQGTIVAVGLGKNIKGFRVLMDVKVGDVVLFPPFVGHTIKIDGEEHLVLKEEDLFGVLG